MIKATRRKAFGVRRKFIPKALPRGRIIKGTR